METVPSTPTERPSGLVRGTAGVRSARAGRRKLSHADSQTLVLILSNARWVSTPHHLQTGSETPCGKIRMCYSWRKSVVHLLTGIIEASNQVGRYSFDQSLQELLAAKIIDVDTARKYAVNKHRLDLALRGTGILYRSNELAQIAWVRDEWYRLKADDCRTLVTRSPSA